MEQRELDHNHEFHCSRAETEDQTELPPGFRFHPTDEELITHYLSHKILDAGFNAQIIGEIDLNHCEPWELPRKQSRSSPRLRPSTLHSSHQLRAGKENPTDEEVYFFCVRDRKYPTGLRTNRATNAGYWKATGKDREIYRAKILVGMKKTLVFYRGRAPRGEKTNWIMHEYRMDHAKSDWVLCRIFKKSFVGSGKKAERLGVGLENGSSLPPPPPVLPPLMDFQAHVTCFSKAHEEPEVVVSSGIYPTIFFSKYDPFANLLDGDEYEKDRELLSMLKEELSAGNKIGRNSLEQCFWNC